MDARGLAADEQLIGDLLVGPAAGDQSQDLVLTGREAEAGRRRRLCLVRHRRGLIAKLEASLPGEQLHLPSEWLSTEADSDLVRGSQRRLCRVP